MGPITNHSHYATSPPGGFDHILPANLRCIVHCIHTQGVDLTNEMLVYACKGVVPPAGTDLAQAAAVTLPAPQEVSPREAAAKLACLESSGAVATQAGASDPAACAAYDPAAYAAAHPASRPAFTTPSSDQASGSQEWLSPWNVSSTRTNVAVGTAQLCCRSVVVGSIAAPSCVPCSR